MTGQAGKQTFRWTVVSLQTPQAAPLLRDSLITFIFQHVPSQYVKQKIKKSNLKQKSCHFIELKT
ncbi:Uncharacterized protein dnl_60130 [Desulfonema limicola]|uniref:Uncharacterized protein n=1 Tax=Desulfonema limicola TaxID=45656 RepID=A0A975B9D4_9BACT|nr:Uncharacterized protein dnl_05920 [Desulfonema limicola]QTA81331.1 Uncharacterized protein dnl_36630 [Desulfonema limicola]QTA83600.1 Uncharacterized protein dnl_60130 [Desulfonema limicola]